MKTLHLVWNLSGSTHLPPKLMLRRLYLKMAPLVFSKVRAHSWVTDVHVSELKGELEHVGTVVLLFQVERFSYVSIMHSIWVLWQTHTACVLHACVCKANVLTHFSCHSCESESGQSDLPRMPNKNSR